MDLHERYGLRRVVNAYDKATHLGGARVAPEVAEVVAQALPLAFDLDDIQDAAGRAIAQATGAEWGCVTACAAAGIALGAAAAMAGSDPARIAQLPDTEGIASRVLLQKGHAVSFGAPVPQMIRLSGAEVVEVGLANGCSRWQVERELARGGVAAIVCVESYHTVRYPGLKVPELAEIAGQAGVPLVVDAATQELRLRELVAQGPDLVVCSAHKYLASTTAGVVAGRRGLVEAVRLQSGGIGRAMKVGKEGILGVLAAFETPMWKDTESWRRREREKVERIVRRLGALPGVEATAIPDPNGCPFERARLRLDPGRTGHTPRSLREALLRLTPAVHVRVYAPDEGCVFLNATEMEPSEVEAVCDAIEEALKPGT